MEKLKRTLFILVMFFTVCSVQAANALKKTDKASIFDWSRVIDAIIMVESEGNPYAKSGNSVGVMQITPIMVADCNQILKSRKSNRRYTLADRFSVKKSKEMFLLYQSKYNPNNNVEKAIRSWNGGNNYSVRSTQRYFEKVKAAMKHRK
jgi:predicted NACHT family NTPase